MKITKKKRPSSVVFFVIVKIAKKNIKTSQNNML
ncbi:MAG: hypothetical protein PWQ81_167 [Bacteroidota bacterium]|nr:hypothetical protein [Bacteroidota bacterium]